MFEVKEAPDLLVITQSIPPLETVVNAPVFVLIFCTVARFVTPDGFVSGINK